MNGLRPLKHLEEKINCTVVTSINAHVGFVNSEVFPDFYFRCHPVLYG